MLTDAERELWNDIERRYAAEFERSARATLDSCGGHVVERPEGMDLSAVLVVGARVTIALILLGAVTAGLVVGAATGLGGVLLSYRFAGSGADTASCSACARRSWAMRRRPRSWSPP